jgi:hypothetical protein
MKAIFDTLTAKINREIGWLLGVFRCGWSDRYIAYLLERQGITIEFIDNPGDKANVLRGMEIKK